MKSRIVVVFVATVWALAGCGGASFTAADPPDTGADDGGALGMAETSSPLGDAGTQPETSVEAASPESATVTVDAADAGSPPGEDAAPDARVDAPTVVADAQPEAGDAGCAGDLSGIDRGDFHISFDVMGASGGGALVYQQAVCSGQGTVHWGISEQADGNTVIVEFGDATSFTVLQGVTNVNDGAWHHVVVARVSGTLSITIDANLDNSIGGANWSLTTLPLLQVGRDVCGSSFPGQIKDVCVARQ